MRRLLARDSDVTPRVRAMCAMKPDWIQCLSRPVKFAYVNGDGRLDLGGALIHNDGNLPKAKASAFWLSRIR
jgi:hypothetical protein